MSLSTKLPALLLSAVVHCSISMTTVVLSFLVKLKPDTRGSRVGWDWLLLIGLEISLPFSKRAD